MLGRQNRNANICLETNEENNCSLLESILILVDKDLRFLFFIYLFEKLMKNNHIDNIKCSVYYYVVIYKLIPLFSTVES